MKEKWLFVVRWRETLWLTVTRGFVACGVMMLVGATGCGDTQVEETERSYPYRIVTTVGMITDLTREVAGEQSTVIGLIDEGVDPHLYNPTRSDVARLMNADIIFYNGLMLEGKMGDVLVRVGRTGRPVYAVTDLIDPAYLLDHDELEDYHDPHVWMDVSAWMQALDVIADSLVDFDPLHADGYRQRAAAYRSRMEHLDAYVRSIMATLPEHGRTLITAHDAFNYFGRAYGIDVIGIQGLSTESEAGLQDINRLVDTLLERDISAVFVETSVAEKNVRALIEGARARGHSVRVGGTLFSDAMGAPGTYEGTYLGMLDHNATTIVRALGGEAPAGGWQDKLSIQD